VNNKDELLDRLVQILKDDIPNVIIHEAAKDLQIREKSGGCAVPGRSVSILHTRTKGVEKPFFGVYRLKNSIPMKNMDGKIEDVETILIMMLPENTRSEAGDVMGKISVALLENSHWIQLLKKGSSTEIIQEIVKITR
ncbi:MAG TPA: PTS sugar transporter subunit IIA, partial [Thermoanaerobacterales bacterium]|nr:PTS sugar transporter subunit IIA [Thermoanaerobacterales bacterium]